MERRAALALSALLVLPGPARAGDAEQVLSGADWKAPATVEAAASRPALRKTVAAYLGVEAGWVRIAHAGGARGSAWAHEVRAWLIALGIPGARIQIDPGMAERATLRLAVRTGEERM
ncbi:MAG TPA: hypothetical protein VKA55_11025 [Gammaproteobacteria bacterium]|nr:hypothetical protein [Gammaproteobacteria bacterium]